jgi:hypothetical protein
VSGLDTGQISGTSGRVNMNEMRKKNSPVAVNVPPINPSLKDHCRRQPMPGKGAEQPKPV